MEATIRQPMTVFIPPMEMDVFNTIADKFGWKIPTSAPLGNEKKTAFEKSQEDIAAGRVNTYASSEELFKKLKCI